MPSTKTARLRPFIIAFKFLIFLAAIYVIYQKLSHSQELDLANFSEIWSGSKNSKFVLLVVGLMAFLNWDLESRKWQLLMKNYEPLSFSKAFRSVLAGSTVSFVSPNRSGAFIGRVLFLESKNRGQGTGMSILGGFAQTLISLVVGLIALSFCLFPNEFLDHKNLIIFLGILATIIFALFYFRSQWLSKFEFQNKIFKQITEPFLEIKDRLRLKVLGLSLLRYLVFCIQFALLLSLTGLDLSFTELLLSVFIIYFIMGLLPSLWLGNLGPRELISIMVISSFYPSEFIEAEHFKVIWPSILLWLVNLCIPALLGSIFLLANRVKS